MSYPDFPGFQPLPPCSTVRGLHLSIGIALALALSACGGQFAYVKPADLTAAEQCMAAQQEQAQQLKLQQRQLHDQQRELADQRQQFTNALNGLSGTFASLFAANLKNVTPPPAAPATCTPAANTMRTTSTSLGNKQLVGATEQVRFPELGLKLEARIDTGATTSSLHAEDIQLFERDGHKWVRFKLPEVAEKGGRTVERKLVRTVLIRQSTSQETQQRRVIRLQIQIGHVTQDAEFTLTNRSDMEFPVLVGRNVLRDLMVVDVSRKDIAFAASGKTAKGQPDASEND
ncbi:MAG: ATP-dependent zinc protease [Nevskiaceae bacterium]|nr:MAG: ATP-dependent zinc protease [Nevskiaceae bacterium]TBR74608.1 MAG: ATP-dependent zinc protease [Nevskiaceae bacterium]